MKLFLIIIGLTTLTFALEPVTGFGGISFKTSSEELIAKGYEIAGGQKVTETSTDTIFFAKDSTRYTYEDDYKFFISTTKSTIESAFNASSGDALGNFMSPKFVEDLVNTSIKISKRKTQICSFYREEKALDKFLDYAVGVPIFTTPYILMTKFDTIQKVEWLTIAYLFNTGNVVFQRVTPSYDYNSINQSLTNKYGKNAELFIDKVVSGDNVKTFSASVYGTTGTGRVRVVHHKAISNREIPDKFKFLREQTGVNISDAQLQQLAGEATMGVNGVIYYFYYDKSFIDQMKVVYDNLEAQERAKLTSAFTELKAKLIAEQKDNF